MNRMGGMDGMDMGGMGGMGMGGDGGFGGIDFSKLGGGMDGMDMGSGGADDDDDDDDDDEEEGMPGLEDESADTKDGAKDSAGDKSKTGSSKIEEVE